MRGKITASTATVLIVVAGLLLPAVGRADLTVKEETQMSGMMGMLSSKGTETTYIKGDKMRSEGKMEAGGMMGGMMQGGGVGDASDVITITRLDKGVLWVVNNDDSTYVEMSLKGTEADSGALGGMKVKDISVKTTGRTKTIISYKCEGTEVDITFEMAMGEGKEREVRTYNVKTLFWMRPEVKDMEEFRKFWDRMVDVARVSQEGGPMTEAMGPVFGKLKEIQGVPLGVEMTMANPMGGADMDSEQRAEMQQALEMMRQMMKGQGQAADGEESSAADEIRVTRYVTAITRGSLSDALFELPRGYTKAESLEGMMVPGQGDLPGN